jgi:hypothetical protein
VEDGIVHMQEVAMKSVSIENAAHVRAIRNSNTAASRIKDFLRKIAKFDIIDGDVFLESEDWPYLWRKQTRDRKQG